MCIDSSVIRGLDACFDGVERIDEKVDGESGEGAGLAVPISFVSTSSGFAGSFSWQKRVRARSYQDDVRIRI